MYCLVFRLGLPASLDAELPQLLTGLGSINYSVIALHEQSKFDFPVVPRD